jgi:hypothetical protein
MPKDGRVTEHEVADAVTQYLADNGGEATIAELVDGLPNYLSLSDADQQQSETRAGERLWEQQVRNIISHRNTPGNAIHDGKLEYLPKGDDRHGRLRLV